MAQLKKVEREQYLARLRAEQARQTRPRRKPVATPKAATNDRNFGAEVPAVARPAGPTAASVPPVGGWSKASNAASAVERQQACPTPAGAAIARETVDDNLLGRLTDLFKQADHATRLAFLGQPVVQIAIQRVTISEVRK